MGALNLPSASDLERLTRRVRSVSQRLEGIEDGLDRLEDRLERPELDAAALEERLARDRGGARAPRGQRVSQPSASARRAQRQAARARRRAVRAR